MNIFKNIKDLKNIQKKLLQEKILKHKLLQEKIFKHNNEVKIIKKYNELNSPFLVKNTYNQVIPLNMYTCWHTKELPLLMQKNYDALIKQNPEFKHFLYDENECRDFIRDNFDEIVVMAYDTLIPYAYKADLWRYCILYKKGGIYLDIKYKCVNGFKLIYLTEKEYFVRDRPDNCVYNALIVTMPKNQKMLECINQIVENVKNKYYGINALFPTGPGVLGLFFSKEERNTLELYFQETIVEGKINDSYIVYQGKMILNYYSKYREEQKLFQKNKRYNDLWSEKNIYNNI
jgi:mannosyltransferase OCH1-like enzyme